MRSESSFERLAGKINDKDRYQDRVFDVTDITVRQKCGKLKY